MTYMQILDNFLVIKKDKRDIFDIIGWWEIRRIPYNLIVLICGLLSLAILSRTVKLEGGKDLVEPFLILVFAVLCNVCYTMGWLTEILIKRNKNYGPFMYKAGLIFTIIWVFLPAVLHAINFIFFK